MTQAGKKPIAEHCRVLDAAVLIRRGVLREWTCAADDLRWTDGWSLSLEVQTAAAAPFVRVTYTVPGTNEHMDYIVPLLVGRPRRGGATFWFLCPMVGEGVVCQRPAQKLYLVPGQSVFCCRHCGRVSYRSRNDPKSAALVKAQAIRVLLGGTMNVFEPFPLKPARMWTKRYDRLRQKAEAAQAAYDLKFDGWMARLDGVIQRRQREMNGRD